METFEIGFTELKNIRREVLDIIEDQTGLSENEMTLDLEIENDLGCTGDDASELLEKLYHRFQIDFTGFEFEKHFKNEGSGSLSFLLLPLIFLFWIFGFIIQKLVLIFGIKLKNNAWQFFTLPKRELEITVGDLIVMAATKRFLLRKDINIQLS